MSELENKFSEVDTKKTDLSDRWLSKLRNHPLIAAIIVAGVGITYLSGLWGAVPDRLREAVLAQLPHDDTSGVLTSGFDNSFFNGAWFIKYGRDQSLDNYKPRYTYTGTLKGYVKSGKFILDGMIPTYNISDNTIKGTARFVYEGTISNNQTAGFFTYTNETVKGFGTCFIEFDAAGIGTMYLIVRATRVMPGEGDVAAVRMIIEHQK
jgi:hypothetical protein